MNMRLRLLVVVPVLILGISSLSTSTDAAGAKPVSVGSSGDSAAIEYVDVSAYLTSEVEIDAWYTLLSNLRQNFDDVCGDTFCEGDYSNIQSLRYRCSVERTSGMIGSSLWVFAASNEEIGPRTGRVLVAARHWQCRSPLARETTIHAFLNALSGAAPLQAPLPGTDRTLYDGLTSCL